MNNPTANEIRLAMGDADRVSSIASALDICIDCAMYVDSDTGRTWLASIQHWLVVRLMETLFPPVEGA